MTLALSVLPLVFIIACGYLLAKTNILPKADWKGIETLSFRVLIPAVLILTITRTDLSLGRFGGVMIALLLTWAVLAALAAAEQFIGTQGLGVMAVAIALRPLIAPCIFAALAAGLECGANAGRCVGICSTCCVERIYHRQTDGWGCGSLCRCPDMANAIVSVCAANLGLCFDRLTFARGCDAATRVIAAWSGVR